MEKINSKIIASTISNLLEQANTLLPETTYKTILNEKNKTNDIQTKMTFEQILTNSTIANQCKRPLCQDTGQVIVFLKIGQNILITGEYINDAINKAVAKTYISNFYRKSVVYDALFNRLNTKNNTPAIIHVEYMHQKGIEIDVMIKGGGAENKSELLMFSPTVTKQEIAEKIAKIVDNSGTSACPPLFLGIGIGSTAEQAMLLSKKAFFITDMPFEIKKYALYIKDYVNKTNSKSNLETTVLDVKILTSSTHIACMPVAISFNCHCLRHASCKIKNGRIFYSDKKYIPDFFSNTTSKGKKVFADDLKTLKNIKSQEKILLTGYIYTARDAAHQKIAQIFNEKKRCIPALKDKILFYAGPCPKNETEVIGPIGPTTSARMDKFSKVIADCGIAATIGKGERNQDTQHIFKKNNIKYFTLQGGVACLVSKCVKFSEIIAFPELDTEAVYKLYVENLPLVCQF